MANNPLGINQWTGSAKRVKYKTVGEIRRDVFVRNAELRSLGDQRKKIEAKPVDTRVIKTATGGIQNAATREMDRKIDLQRNSEARQKLLQANRQDAAGLREYAKELREKAKRLRSMRYTRLMDVKMK